MPTDQKILAALIEKIGLNPKLRFSYRSPVFGLRSGLEESIQKRRDNHAN
jgi:hypothetical protein